MEQRADARSKPLEQKVEYNFEEHLIYGRQKKWKKVIEWILTIVCWFIIFTFVGYYIYGNLAIKKGWKLFEIFYLNRRMIAELNRYCFIAFIAFLILVVFLIFWKNYNYHRFGKLHRRKFRPDVNNQELSEMFELDNEFIEKMQNERYILLETNIIPKDMGVGYKANEDDKKKSNDKKAVKQ